MKSWFALTFLVLLTTPVAQADTMRCGSKLVYDEDTLEQVRAKCGEAAEVQRSSLWRRPVIWLHGRPYTVGDDLVEVPVEIWTYNFGPHKLMRRVRFEDGLVVEIETLGYGYIK